MCFTNDSTKLCGKCGKSFCLDCFQYFYTCGTCTNRSRWGFKVDCSISVYKVSHEHCDEKFCTKFNFANLSHYTPAKLQHIALKRLSTDRVTLNNKYEKFAYNLMLSPHEYSKVLLINEKCTKIVE